MNLISLRAYAKHRDVSLAAVQKARDSGRISLIEGKIDPEVADIQWAKNTRPDKQENGSLKEFEKTQAQLSAGIADFELSSAKNSEGNFNVNGLSVEKAETEAIRRQLMELQLAKQKGELVNKQDIERAMAAKLIDARSALNNLANELAPSLAAETDVLKVKLMLQKKINAAMSAISQEAPAAIQ